MIEAQKLADGFILGQPVRWCNSVISNGLTLRFEIIYGRNMVTGDKKKLEVTEN